MAVATDLEARVKLFLELAAKKINIVQAFLFGSSVKDERHKWSDIDLAIVSPDFSGDSFEDLKILIPIIIKVDRSIEIHTFHPKDFTVSNPFVKEILESGVQII
jgi:predicted nucleotidyltransferase